MKAAEFDLIVLGAGPAGLTAGLYAHRSGLKVFMLGGDTPGGQVTRHYNVENFPAFPGGVTGVELMARWIQQVIAETGSMPLSQTVDAVDLSGTVKRVRSSGTWYGARAVIIATGSSARRLGVAGEAELEGKGVFFCATCDGPLLRTMNRRRAVVIGGGDTALHTALALLPHAESITVITRGSPLRAKSILVERFSSQPHTNFLFNKAVTGLEGIGSLERIVLEDTVTGVRETIPAEACFVGIGQQAITGFLGGALMLDDQGFIVTDTQLRTSVSGVFAGGDVRVTPLRQIVTAAADGALAAHSAAEYLRLIVG